MAQKMGSGTNLAPGGTHVWQWNNYVHDLVYSFAAKPLSEGYYNGEKQARIANVKYVVTPQHDAPSKTKIVVEITNPGSTSVNYDLYISWA